MRWLRGLAAVLAVPLLMPIAAIAAPTARDHGGNRIEQFRQIGQTGPPENLRNCTEDRIWCAALQPDRANGRWVLHVTARPEGRVLTERRWRYTVPVEQCCDRPGRSVGIWQEVVREAFGGGALIGLELWQETGARPGFFSFQRRLLLLRLPREGGGTPVPVLEAPLSGHVEQPVCPYPGNEYYEIAACQDSFTFSTLFTLLPSIGPIVPPNLIMVASAETAPGHRTRAGGPVRRSPIERTNGNLVRDPACSYTRSFYFDEAQGRYLPDAPLPLCRDYLEP